MIVVQRIAPNDVALFKSVRLRALQDSPSAFGATYAAELALTDAEWAERTQRWSGEGFVACVAMDGQTACGIVAAYLDAAHPGCARLISMWTSPAHRRSGVGRLLVHEVVSWAAANGVDTLHLLVNATKDTAVRFYTSLGFESTGHAEPHPNLQDEIVLEMSRPIAFEPSTGRRTEPG